jgi:iron complex transport system substrate-binding protein
MPTLSPCADLTRREFVGWMTAAGVSAAALSGCQSEPPATSVSGRRSVQGHAGPVEVPAAPSRVVAADSISLGHLLALGVTPVAAAVNVNSLPTYQAEKMVGVVDVTDGDGMNLEKALGVDPDLIVSVVGTGGEAWNTEAYERYAAAMDTFGYLTGYTYIEEIEGGLQSVAAAVAQESRAAEVVQAYRRRVDALASRVTAAGLVNRPVSVLRLSKGAYSIRIGTSESIALRALGISQPAGQRDPADFSIELSMERFDLLNRADTLFVYADDNAAADRKLVEASPLWTSLAPVRRGRVRWVSSGVWNSIDLVGLQRILDDIEAGFVAPNGG